MSGHDYRVQPPMPGGVQIDLARQFGKQPLARWHHPGDHPAFEGYLTLGRLDDGRWYVDSSVTEAVGGWAFLHEDKAKVAVGLIKAIRPDDLWHELAPRAYDPSSDRR